MMTSIKTSDNLVRDSVMEPVQLEGSVPTDHISSHMQSLMQEGSSQMQSLMQEGSSQMQSLMRKRS
jgi:hypothetical protein